MAKGEGASNYAEATLPPYDDSKASASSDKSVNQLGLLSRVQVIVDDSAYTWERLRQPIEGHETSRALQEAALKTIVSLMSTARPNTGVLTHVMSSTDQDGETVTSAAQVSALLRSGPLGGSRFDQMLKRLKTSAEDRESGVVTVILTAGQHILSAANSPTSALKTYQDENLKSFIVAVVCTDKEDTVTAFDGLQGIIPRFDVVLFGASDASAKDSGQSSTLEAKLLTSLIGSRMEGCGPPLPSYATATGSEPMQSDRQKRNSLFGRP